MSNFICSECGMTNIDCGCAGYKTPKEIELEKEIELYKRAIERTDRIEKCLNQEGQIKRLQEQLRIAIKALKEIRKGIEDFNDDPMNKIGFMAYGTLHECLKKSKKALKEMEGVK